MTITADVYFDVHFHFHGEEDYAGGASEYNS